MNPILAAGLLIGVFCGLWTFVMGFTGWYKDPVMMRVFYVAILIQFGGLMWGLRQTARQGRGWANQVLAGTFMSIIAGIIVMGFSLLFTTVLVPDFFAELERVGRTNMQQQGATEAEITQALHESRRWATPMAYALAGFLTTLFIGIVASAAIALVVRAKPLAGESRPPVAPGPNHR